MATIASALAILKACLEEQFPGLTPGKLTVEFEEGDSKIQLDLPKLKTPADDFEEFEPTACQRAILKALNGKAMKTCALGAAIGDRSRIFKPGGIKELQERGLVDHSDEYGFYRPDAPPSQLKKE